MSADDYDSPLDERRREMSESSTGSRPSGAEVDWMAVWQEFGAKPDQSMSMTQLKLVCEVSEHTGDHGRGSHRQLLQEAEEAGLLSRTQYIKYKPNAENEVADGPYVLSREVRQG